MRARPAHRLYLCGSCRADFEKKAWMLHPPLRELAGAWALGHGLPGGQSRSLAAGWRGTCWSTPSFCCCRADGPATGMWAAQPMVGKGGRTAPSKALPTVRQLPAQNPPRSAAVSAVRQIIKKNQNHFIASFFMARKEEAISVPTAFRELGFKPKFCNFNHGRKSFPVPEACSQLPFSSACKAVSPHSCTVSQKAFLLPSAELSLM